MDFEKELETIREELNEKYNDNYDNYTKLNTSPRKIIKDSTLEDILEQNKDCPSFVLELIEWLYNANEEKLNELLYKLKESKEIYNLIDVDKIDYDKLKSL